MTGPTPTGAPDPVPFTVGQQLRSRRPMVCFHPAGHPRRTTDHGPLLSRGARLRYVGPMPGRDGIHLARFHAGDGYVWDVPFRPADVMA